MNFAKIKADLTKVYDDLAKYWGKDEMLHDWGETELKEFAALVFKDSPGLYGDFQSRLGKIRKRIGPRVLDLGCGSGVQSKLLTDQGLTVVGLDFSPKMIEEARKRAPKVKFVVGDMTEIRFDKEFFDGVYARASLLHIPKQFVPRVLKSVHKILKKGGVLYLAVKEGEGEGEVEDERNGKKVRRFFSFFKKSELIAFLEEASFKILKVSRFKRTKTSTYWLQVLACKI